MSFMNFAAACGLLPKSIISDAKIHRCATLKHPRGTNGAYMFDGKRGWCMSWDSGQGVQWWNDPTAKPWTEQDKKQWADKRRAEIQQKEIGYKKAAEKASQLLSDCVVDAHPYLRSKQLPHVQGMVNSEGSLLIPMRDFLTNKLSGVQSIFFNENRDGFVKKFLPGMRAKGSVFNIGSGKRTILVEGYATALSVYEAAKRMNLDVSVMSCFSALNMVFVAQKKGHFIMADNDKSKTGELAAIETGLPWHMPVNEGMDWNDVHAEYGLMEVCLAIKDLLRKVA